MTKIAVVFGGSGFIGRLITSRLAQAGYTVRVPSRVRAHAEPLHQLGVVGQVVPLLIDPSHAPSVASAVRGADVVINCIGILNETRSQKFDAVQSEIPGIIARAAAHADATTYIHISAIGADANSESQYARSKAAGEGMVRALFPQATILRPSIVFGPDDSFFNRFAKMAVVSPILPLIGGGQTKFQPVYVGDVAAAVMAAIDSPAARGKLYELGGPAIYSFKALLQIMLRVVGRKRLLVPLPWKLAMLKARLLENLPGKLLTRDQVTLLKNDNIVNAGAKTLADLGINATALEAIIPTYLDRFRPNTFVRTGQFR